MSRFLANPHATPDIRGSAANPGLASRLLVADERPPAVQPLPATYKAHKIHDASTPMKRKTGAVSQTLKIFPGSDRTKNRFSMKSADTSIDEMGRGMMSGPRNSSLGLFFRPLTVFRCDVFAGDGN